MIKLSIRKVLKRKEQFRGKSCLLFVLLCSFFVLFLLDGALIGNRAEAAFTNNVPYQQAIPDFTQAIADATASVKDEGELEEIRQWEEETRARLPEFLDDLITIAEQLEENGNEDFIIDEYQAFADKWNTIVHSYPGLSELEPILSPIIDQLLSGLPTLQPNTSDNPVGNVFELYVEMTQLSPWFVGFLWNIPPIEDEQKVSAISEMTREITTNGYKSIDIVRRDTHVLLNGISVFSESIEDGTLANRMALLRGPSVLHETLEQMIKDGGARREIAIIQEFIDIINLNLKFSLQNGIIDDCSYSYIFRKQLIGVKETCIDINGNERNFSELSKYSPFDFVNQVELTHVDPLANLTIPSGSTVPIPNTISPEIEPIIGNTVITVPDPPVFLGNDPPVNLPLEAWLLGILTPTYLWSAAGFIRLF